MKSTLGRYIFTYDNGRRAIQGSYDISTDKAMKMASKLSKEKKRVIVLRSITFIYETERYGRNVSGMDMPIDHTYEPVVSFKDGKINRRYR